MNSWIKEKVVVEPKDPIEDGQGREQLECSQRRCGSVEAKKSKGSCSKGSIGEETEIPKEQARGEIAC